MKMNEYINDFTNHLTEAIKIGESVKFRIQNKKFKNILICGLGGSGIGGTIVNDIISPIAKIPIYCTKDYSVPNFVDSETLVIASSYSGNTEETIYALEKCQKTNAEICIITSGGKLHLIAKEEKYNHIIIPSGGPPRLWRSSQNGLRRRGPRPAWRRPACSSPRPGRLPWLSLANCRSPPVLR